MAEPPFQERSRERSVDEMGPPAVERLDHTRTSSPKRQRGSELVFTPSDLLK